MKLRVVSVGGVLSEGSTEKSGSDKRIYIHTHTHTHRVIQKDGLNFVSLYFKLRTSDKKSCAA